MAGLFFFIDQIAVGLYILLAAIILYQLRQLVSARLAYRSTYFELERDLARFRQANAITTIIIIIEMAVILLGVQRVIVPYMQADLEREGLLAQQAVVEDLEFNTPTPNPDLAGVDIEPVPEIGDDEEGVLLLTPTLTPTPVGTIIPNAPAVEGCTDDRATLQVPTNGMRVFQPIPVIGTAFTEDFAYAKIEISGPGTFDNFVVIDDRRSPTRETSEFSQFVPAPYEPGLYQFRVMVFDLTDTVRAACMVNIYITEPPVTPTPTPQGGGSSNA